MKVVCEHCGLPFSVARPDPGRKVYCCSGCALAARVPVDAKGQFPVNAALVTALGVGFVFFNQVLFWLLAVLLSRQASETNAINAGRFILASLATALAVWGAVALFQMQSGARRALDWLLLGATLLGLGWALAMLRPEIAVIANLVFGAWALRGLARKKVPAKK
jgi:hypothetical protein